MPAFNPNQIAVFDRAGLPIGVITGWSVEQPRSYRFNEVEEFVFSLPRTNLVEGTDVVTDTVWDVLLRRDNLIYIQNAEFSMRGWGGEITRVSARGGKVYVRVAGAAGKLLNLKVEAPIHQSGGLVWTIAQRILGAAQAKQAAHGDLIIDFRLDETPGSERRNFGTFDYTGDVLAGLQQLADDTVSEWFVHSRITASGRLRMSLRWGGRWHIDHRDIVIKDGDGGNLLPDNEVSFSSTDVRLRARLRGASTNLARWVDYASVRGVVHDVTPEVELTLDDQLPGQDHRMREDLDMTVGYGYNEEVERDLARQVQEKYLGFYKAFLYAYHQDYGKPFLEGYDWTGPDGNNDKKLTAHYFRSVSHLAVIGKRTVLVGSTDDDDTNFIEARFDDWQFRQNVTPVPNASGAAVDFSATSMRFIADESTGNIVRVDEDFVVDDDFSLHVTGPGETLRSIATDDASPAVIWALVAVGGTTKVRSYNLSSDTLLAEWDTGEANANDITTSAELGIMWLVVTGSGDVQARDINNGTELTTPPFATFASGHSSAAGLAQSGGLAYVISSSGSVRFLFIEDGNLAGTLSTSTASKGLFVDVGEGQVWIIKTDGSIDVYRAHIAVAAISAPGSVEGSPGFESISAGQFVHIVMVSDHAASPHPRNKIAIMYSPGRYVTQTVPTTVGQPDLLTRTWVTGDPKFAILPKSKVHTAYSEQVIQGEESRVDDWDPKADGYGIYGRYIARTRKGVVLKYFRQWHLIDWDIPDSEFFIDPPEWDEGLQELQRRLAILNKERPVQVLRVNNSGNLFRKLVHGGEYTIQVTRQGPPAGLSGVLRLLAFTPDDRQGIAELIGEWV